MATSDTHSFTRLLKGLLRPLVRVLIARGVSAPTLYRVLKSVYVEVAHSDFRIDDAPPTDSRITLLTGVHRRDVRAILTDPDNAWEEQRSASMTLATVVGQWIVRPEYLAPDGSPLPLPRHGEDGPSFEALVSSINRDIRARTVLDELLRLGLVIEDDNGLLQVTAEARSGPTGDKHRDVFFAANLGDHIAAAAANLETDPAPFLERAVFYNRLSAAAVDRIEARARELSQAALEELSAEGSRSQARDGQAGDAVERFRYGVYFYRDRGGQPAPGGERDSEDN